MTSTYGYVMLISVFVYVVFMLARQVASVKFLVRYKVTLVLDGISAK